MIGTTVQPSHEPPHERKGTGIRHTENISGEKPTKPRGRGEGKKMAHRNKHEGKLNVPMNHMIHVASYWACACQRPLTSGTKGALSC